MKENVFFIVERKKETSLDSTQLSPSQKPFDTTTLIGDNSNAKYNPTNKKDHQVMLSKKRYLKRKTYSEGYNTGRWNEAEHRRFIEAIFNYGNDWKKVQRHILSRSSAQARSHAQKFFIRLRNKLNFRISIEDLDSNNSQRFSEIFEILTKYIKKNYHDDEEMSHVNEMKKNSSNLIDMLCYFHKKIQAERKWKYLDQMSERFEQDSDMEKESQSTDIVFQNVFQNVFHKIAKNPIFKVKKLKEKYFRTYPSPISPISSPYIQENGLEKTDQTIYSSYMYMLEKKINECKRLQSLYLPVSTPLPCENNVYEKMMSFFNISKKEENIITSTTFNPQMDKSTTPIIQNFSFNKSKPVNLFNNDFLNLEYQMSKNVSHEYNINEINPFKIDFTSESSNEYYNNHSLYNCFYSDEDKDNEKRNYYFN